MFSKLLKNKFYIIFRDNLLSVFSLSNHRYIALASGKRVALLASFSNFSNREYFLKNNIEKKYKFGFELKAKAKAKSGFFWSGKMSEKEALRILDNVVYSNNQKWKIELKKIKNLMLYDYYNKVFFKKMKKINFPIKERFNTNVKK